MVFLRFSCPLLPLLVVVCPVAVKAYSTRKSLAVAEKSICSRKAFFGNVAAASLAACASIAAPAPAKAVDDPSQLTDVYFGVGCYWHIQHEFVEAERNFLGVFSSTKCVLSRHY